MLISCPECNAVYKISSDNISDDGKKFKCAECSHIWLVKPEDLKNIEPEIENPTENTEDTPVNNAEENGITEKLLLEWRDENKKV